MRIPKKYGESKIASCPFCGTDAFTKNKQGVPVCKPHANKNVGDLKCACGRWLDLKQGKYGPFFTCTSCGVVNLSKAREINQGFENKRKPEEITMRSDEVDLF